MKRIKAACITQTIHFLLKEGMGHSYAVKMVNEEYEKYKVKLDKSAIKYKILKEEKQEEDSIIIEIKKQYNTTPVGNYIE